MKVVLTGSTGFIGGEVLEQCLRSSSMTSVVVLSRRELAASLKQENSKLKVVVVKDFTNYSDDVLQELDGVDACIWSLGKAVVGTNEEARRISFDYTLAATKAFQQISSRRNDGKFRFVYLSGRIAERDQSRSLWYMQEHRRIRVCSTYVASNLAHDAALACQWLTYLHLKGQLENDLISFAHDHSDTFETYIVKPSMVLAKEPTFIQWLCSKLIATVRVDTLADAMIQTATEGRKLQTMENSDIAA